jgi:hypothetical protein
MCGRSPFFFLEPGKPFWLVLSAFRGGGRRPPPPPQLPTIYAPSGMDRISTFTHGTRTRSEPFRTAYDQLHEHDLPQHYIHPSRISSHPSLTFPSSHSFFGYIESNVSLASVRFITNFSTPIDWIVPVTLYKCKALLIQTCRRSLTADLEFHSRDASGLKLANTLSGVNAKSGTPVGSDTRQRYARFPGNLAVKTSESYNIRLDQADMAEVSTHPPRKDTEDAIRLIGKMGDSP